MKILKKDIKDKNFKKFYLFYGEEEYLKRYYENEMKTKVVTNMKEFNIDVFDGKELITTVLEDCINTAPFMSEYRLIIIKNSDLFAGTKKAEEEKAAKDKEAKTKVEAEPEPAKKEPEPASKKPNEKENDKKEL